VPFESIRKHLFRVVELALVDRMHDCVEHERDPGERLHRAVMKKQRQPAPLVLFRGDQSFGEPSELG